MITTLTHILKQNLGANIGRHIRAAYPKLYSDILDRTKFLDGKARLTFTERVYCVLNDIHHIVLTAYGNPAIFEGLDIGYVLKLKLKARQDNKAPGPKRTMEEHVANNAAMARAENLKYALLINSTDELRGGILKKHVKFWPTGPGKKLYKAGLIEGIDYVVCPLTKLRKTSIRKNYTVNILGMTMDQYLDIVGKDFVLICPGHKANLSASLRVIDEATGLTKTGVATEKVRIIMNTVDPVTGLTGHNRRTAKTVATHKARIDENGLNGFQRLVAHRQTTVLPSGLTIEQAAHIKRNDVIAKDNLDRKGSKQRASKVSKVVLGDIVKYLDLHEIMYYFDKNEYAVREKGSRICYFYDLTIPSLKCTVEYQSNAYHADPFITDIEWGAWKPARGRLKTAQEVLMYDYDKARTIFKERGFVTFHVWENSVATDVEVIRCFIEMTNTRS